MPFPVELKQLPRWVGYRLEPDKNGGKPRKVPINAVTGKNAASNNPATWCDYETACAAADQFGFSGIGFMFLKDDGFVGVDIDHCYDPATQTFNDIAKAIIARQPTYFEFSPSGDGVHVWYKGTKPKGPSKNSATGVEMYDSVRYFTVTERQVPGSADSVAEALPDTLTWIQETFLTKQKAKKKKQLKTGEKLSDEDIIEKASAAGNGEQFTDLMAGKWQEHYPSQSEADMALCMKLAFWSGKDAVQMDRMFRASGLMREKWDQQHHADGATYGEETIARAIENTETVYSPGSDSPIFEYEGRYFRTRGDSVYAITNFTVRPIEMILTEDEAQMTCEFIPKDDEPCIMTFMTTELANQQKFKNLLSKRTISLGWFGGDGDLELFKAFIAQLDWPTKYGVKAAGIYQHAGRYVFATVDGAVDAAGNMVDDLVQLDRYQSIKTGILNTELLTAAKLKDLGKWLLAYNETAKTVSILAWTAGCFVKPHLRMEGIKFPHLFLIGEAGSGKSNTMERVILPVFSVDRVTAATQVTAFTLMKESASSNMVPMPLDEFKPSKIDKLKINALFNHFRDSYDGHDGQRGRSDLSVNTFKLLAPLVVAGEEAAEEAAIRERSVELLFSKKDIFNTLTDNGRTQGIYMSNGLLYLNATYMNTGELSAGLITSGKIQSRNGKVYFDLDNNELHCDTLISTSTDNWAKTLKAQIGNYSISTSGGLFYKKGLLISAGDSTATGIFLVPGGEPYGSWGDCPQVSACQKGLSMNVRPPSNGWSSGMGGITFTPKGNVAIGGYVDLSSLTPDWIDSHDDISSNYSSSNCGMIIIRPSMKKYSYNPGGSYVSNGSGYYTTDGEIILRTTECYCQGSFKSYSAKFHTIYGLEGSGGTGVTIFADYIQADDLYVSGSKSRVADTDNYGSRLFYCYEMPSPMFGDIGEACTDADGECVILLDDIFSETVRTDLQYQVFLQKEGEGDLWVDRKTPSVFVVRGTPNLPFAWELKAKQRDYEIKRLESRYSGYEEEKLETPESLYEDELWALIREQEELLYETA